MNSPAPPFTARRAQEPLSVVYDHDAPEESIEDMPTSEFVECDVDDGTATPATTGRPHVIAHAVPPTAPQDDGRLG